MKMLLQMPNHFHLYLLNEAKSFRNRSKTIGKTLSLYPIGIDIQNQPYLMIWNTRK